MFDKVEVFDSSDTNVRKFVFSSENVVAEAVLYKYPTYEERTVICCSTQSGCPVGCRFCGTGEYFVRSLTSDEIVFQVVHLIESTGIDASTIKKFQIMVMSMGEPMLNYKNLEDAFIRLNELYPNAKLLISSVGPRVNYWPLIDLAKRIDAIGLQFSIHESTDEARNQLIPFKKKLTLEQIAIVGEVFLLETGRKPFFNYCAQEHNSTQEDVDRLKSIFNPDVWEATISVVCERDENVAASNARQKQLADDFMSKMINAGYSTRCFDPAGQDDIGGGCGQLWYVQDWMKNNREKARPSIGFGQSVIHAPMLKQKEDASNG